MAHTQRQTVDLSAYPGLSGNLPGNAGSDLARARYLAEFWPEDQRRGRLKTRRLASPRKSSLFSFSDSHGNAPILAGLPISGKLGAELAAPAMVEGLSAGFRRHRLLA